MLKNEDIICISSIDWDFVWQGHQEIMSLLAKNGNRVLFIENTGVRPPGIRDIPRIKNRVKNWFQGIRGIREIEKNLYVFSPIVLPFPYLRIATRINRRLILSVLNNWFKIMDFANPITWVFLPTPLSLNIIDNLISKFIIYYCIDNFRVSSASAKKIKNSEIELLKRADLVFLTSKELYNYCSTYNKNVYFFPFAVNFEQFEKIRVSRDSVDKEISDIRKPIIGYIGGIHKWIDLDLIKELAMQFSEYSFVFIGPIQTDVSSLLKLKNVYLLGKKEHSAIPHFIKNFDVCIIPYLITDYTKNVYPTKLNEYHALGKPVVSTDLPEVIDYNRENGDLVFVARTYKEFIGCIKQALDDSDYKLSEKRIACAQKNSWQKRIEEMDELIEREIGNKKNMPFDWKDNFLNFYRVTSRKIRKLVFSFLSVYLLIFYTPLMWFLASPLKISQMPKKSDCIVVFAGGVGESGKAGQGYEERVEYAVELYSKGYASHMIFSSGYMYVFKEPYVMKALAVSLGVPGNAIILENKAANTYKNIKFSKEILDKNSWSNIILVSSPYHMRRASLVFNKIAQDIKVTYCPIANSLFYSHPDRDTDGRRVWRRVNLRQIKGILHEYLAILSYWREDWI